MSGCYFLESPIRGSIYLYILVMVVAAIPIRVTTAILINVVAIIILIRFKGFPILSVQDDTFNLKHSSILIVLQHSY